MDKTELSVSAFGGTEMTTVKMNRGDVFIGREDLFHAGMAYESFNVRLHMHFDFPRCGRKANQTHVVVDDKCVSFPRSWCVSKEMVRLKAEKREKLRESGKEFSLRMAAAKERKLAV